MKMRRLFSAKKKSFVTTIILIFAVTPASAGCPIGPTQTKPQVSVSVDRDRKSGVYSYKYTLANQVEALVPINGFFLQLDESPVAMPEPKDWLVVYRKQNSRRPSHLFWSADLNPIKPSSSKSDFVIQSRNAPGLVKYFVMGQTGVPVSVTVNGDPEAQPDCPDFFFGKPMFESMTVGMTEGPVPANQISAKIKIKRGKDKDAIKKELEEVRPYQETGMMTVVLKGSKDLDVTDVDIASLRFGMGKAPVVWSELHPGVDDDDREDDQEVRKAKKIWMQFDLDKVDIECPRDHVLFLEGKTKGGKPILAGAPIKAKDCDKKPTNPRRVKERAEAKARVSSDME